MIDIIIITYNSSAFIKNCLLSLKKHEPSSRLIIIDNASTDQTLKIINNLKSKNIIIIKNNKNFGYAHAVNQGLTISSSHILLLNPDTILTMPITAKLAKYLDNKTAAIAPKIIDQNNNLLPSCGNFPSFINLIFDRFPYLKNQTPKSHLIRTPNYYQKIQQPDWATGACLLINKTAVQKIGKFDEDYFLYLEEVDWQFRAHQKGFRTIYLPDINIIHNENQKNIKQKLNKSYYMHQNMIKYLIKHNL